MPQWEVRKLYIPLSVTLDDDVRKGLLGKGLYGVWLNTKSGTETESAWQKASELAAEGWELVSGIPVITGHEDHIKQAGASATIGYFLLFKRMISG